jgi:DNA invertase Pin-like site-specific DNA recombinase
MQELLDMYDKMQITKKLAAGRRTKAKAGSKACGSAPYGYKWDDANIVIDYNNHLVVQDIYRIFADTHSVTATAATTKAKGYKTSTGRDFSKQSISNMIHNDFYIGIVTHDGKKYHGTHDPIIGTELFMSCNPKYVKIP